MPPKRGRKPAPKKNTEAVLDKLIPRKEEKMPKALRIRSTLDNGAPQSEIRVINPPKEKKQRGRKRKAEAPVISVTDVGVKPEKKAKVEEKKEVVKEVVDDQKDSVPEEKKDEKKAKKKYKRRTINKEKMKTDINSFLKPGSDEAKAFKSLWDTYFPPPPPRVKKPHKPRPPPKNPHLQWLVWDKKGTEKYARFADGTAAAKHLGVDVSVLYEATRLRSEKAKERLPFVAKRVIDPNRSQPEELQKKIEEWNADFSDEMLEEFTKDYFTAHPPPKKEKKSVEKKAATSTNSDGKQPEHDENDMSVLFTIGPDDGTTSSTWQGGTVVNDDELSPPPSPLNTTNLVDDEAEEEASDDGVRDENDDGVDIE